MTQQQTDQKHEPQFSGKLLTREQHFEIFVKNNLAKIQQYKLLNPNRQLPIVWASDQIGFVWVTRSQRRKMKLQLRGE